MFFAFRGEPMCFIHVLLNALDMHEHGMEGKIVIEGEAVKLVPEMAQPNHFLHSHYAKIKKKGLIVGACRACSLKTGVTDAIEQEGIPLIGGMMGHPAMSEYVKQGYTILNF